MKVILLQWLLFTFYTTYVWIKYGVQKSISESWYTMGKSENWMFTVVFCWGIGVSMFFYDSIWFVVGGSFLTFVGAATSFKDRWDTTRYVHNIGASGCITLALAGLAVEGIWWPAVAMVAGSYLLLKVDNRTWWIETLAVYVILGGLFQRYL
jgi:hypothetical protein